jgi:hypothetical protein
VQREYLPHDFPHYQSVNSYCNSWRDEGVLERLNTEYDPAGTGQGRPRSRTRRSDHRQLTSRSRAWSGRALIEGGMRVVFSQPETEQQFFEVYSEIAITNPAEPGRGTVHVADHGAIFWECQVHQAAGRSGGLSINQIATTIAQALSRTHQPCCIA